MRTYLAAALLSAAASMAAAQSIVLVTEGEALASRNAPPLLIPRAAPVKDAPLIEIIKPPLSGAVASPTPIEVRFQPTYPATVRPETFKVLYGAFQIDVTARLTSAAKVDAQGISVKEATLPSGRHRLSLSIEDSAGRVGTRQIELDII